jgi:hypothetical protein
MHLLPRAIALSLTADDARDARPRSPLPVDEDYWLGHCEGFQVDGPDGRVGVVEHVVYRSRADRPDVVAVSSGVWRVHTAEVPVGDVVDVFPAQERLVIGHGPAQPEGPTVWSRAQHAFCKARRP